MKHAPKNLTAGLLSLLSVTVTSSHDTETPPPYYVVEEVTIILVLCNRSSSL